MGVEERRHILRDLIPPRGRMQFSEELEGEARTSSGRWNEQDWRGWSRSVSAAAIAPDCTKAWLKMKCYSEEVFDVAGRLCAPDRPTMALMGNKGEYIGGAFITLPKIRERLWARVQAKAKPLAGFMPRPGVEWVEPGIRARVKFLRGDEMLRHASVESIEEKGGEGSDDLLKRTLPR